MEEHSRLRVAVVAENSKSSKLLDALKACEVHVVLSRNLQEPVPTDWEDADVVVIMLDAKSDKAVITSHFQSSTLPILCVDGSCDLPGLDAVSFLEKLRTLADVGESSGGNTSRLKPDLRIIRNTSIFSSERPCVIVLGGSIGGPRALARFFGALPEDLPATFLIAQHISAPAQRLLVEQISRLTAWEVDVVSKDERLQGGHVWLVPSDRAVGFSEDDILLKTDLAWDSIQKPDIDGVLQAASDAYRSRCGAIIFSGIGKDGARGSQSVVENGGFILVQNSESCEMKNMPEATADLCPDVFRGTPEELARELVSRCGAGMSR